MNDITLGDYIRAVARQLDGVKTPDEMPDIENLIDYLWDLWERNVKVETAASLVLMKYGKGEQTLH